MFRPSFLGDNSMSSPAATKPHKSYSELVSLLESRGMIIPDKQRAERKLSQIGYYRLSGFWHPCRKIAKGSDGKGLKHFATHRFIRRDQFQDQTNIDEIIQLYIFDKKLRLLMLDAIERIEIFIRTITAHEMGYHDPLAHQNPQFINPKFQKTWTGRNKGPRNLWNEWTIRQSELIQRSREDCIQWYLTTQKQIPIWVAVEAWDMGTLSKYFELLNGKYQRRICSRLGGPNEKELRNWLREINTLRNRCAHHTRIWNQSVNSPLLVPKIPYFQRLNLTSRARQRMFGMIAILWFLVHQIGPSSHWLNQVADLIDAKPAIAACPNTSMGFSDNRGFPRALFGI